MSGIVVDRECGQFVCDFVGRLPTTDTGKPFVLHPWQRDAIMEFYSTLEPYDEGPGKEAEALVRKYQYLYLEIPKKNGKSELAAALGLYHLFADGEMSAEVYVCAADRDNADIVFLAAVFMLESAPWTAKMVASGELKIIRSKRRIEFRQKQRADNGRVDWVMVGRFQVLSAEAYSKHGYRPSCVIFDELHSQPNRDLWDVMTFGAGSGRRQPVWIVLTTAGDDPDRTSIGWEVHEKAVAIRDARQLRSACAIRSPRIWSRPRPRSWSGICPTGCRCCTASPPCMATTRRTWPRSTSGTRRCGISAIRPWAPTCRCAPCGWRPGRPKRARREKSCSGG